MSRREDREDSLTADMGGGRNSKVARRKSDLTLATTPTASDIVDSAVEGMWLGTLIGATFTMNMFAFLFMVVAVTVTGGFDSPYSIHASLPEGHAKRQEILNTVFWKNSEHVRRAFLYSGKRNGRHSWNSFMDDRLMFVDKTSDYKRIEGKEIEHEAEWYSDDNDFCLRETDGITYSYVRLVDGSSSLSSPSQFP